MSWEISQGLCMPQIVLSRSEIESDDPWETIDALSTFARKANEIGGLRADEFAQEVMLNSQLTRYMTQVSQNGHYLYVCNTGWEPISVKNCRQAMAVMGLKQLSAIFDDLAEIVRRSPRSIDTWLQDYDEIRRDVNRFAPFEALDSRYFALDEDRLLQARKDWIMQLPNLVVVADDAVDETIYMLSETPLRAGRLNELEQQRAEQREQRERDQCIRIADAETMAHADSALAMVRRWFKNDPRKVLPAYWKMDEGLSFPLDAPEEERWFLLLVKNGKVALFRSGEIVNGPKQLPERTSRFVAELLS